MNQLALCVTIMLMAICLAIPWRGLSPAHQPPARPGARPRPRHHAPDLIVPPGKRSKGMNSALKRVQQAVPEAVEHDHGGARRFALIPRVRAEISAVLEDNGLAEAEARELQRAFETHCTYILETHPPVPARNINPLEHMMLKCAAAVVPDSMRWQQEWASEYVELTRYPVHMRLRFLVGLLAAAPRLAWSLRKT